MFSRLKKRRLGYTLIELVVGMGASSALLVGLTSTIVISSQAFDSEDIVTSVRSEASETQAHITADLNHALTFSERTATATTFTVPDRTGDANPDTIRYAWSGTPGDPLTYSINGGTAVNVVEDVQNFNLSYLTRFMEAGGLNVLFIKKDLGNLSNAESKTVNLILLFGMNVTELGAESTQAEYDAALASADAVYVNEEVDSNDVGTKLTGTTVGIVSEEAWLSDELGFSSSQADDQDEDDIEIVNNTHYITEGFALDELDILDTNSKDLVRLQGIMAPGLKILAREAGEPFTGDPQLAVLPAGALYIGGTAAGRRVQLPWGTGSFDTNKIGTNGLIIMERAIKWAAGSGDD